MGGCQNHTQSSRAAGGRCPVHPSEPLTGLCSCGTFFCRRCSPSAVFCASCYHIRLHSGSARFAGAQPAIAGAFTGQGQTIGHRQPRPLTQRIVIEALLLTLATILIMASLMLQQSRSLMADTDGQVFGFGINAGANPLQKSAPYLTASIDSGGATVQFTSDTSYSISARVDSMRAYDDMISPAIPYDLLLSWGKLADPDTAAQYSWKQSNREGTVSGPLDDDLTSSYVIGHVSNNHIIPANDGIRQALGMIKLGDLVRIDGRLVDVKINIGNASFSAHTSKSRTDTGDGACEIIFAEHLRINGQSY